MEVGASTLGDAARVNSTVGCTIGDATHGDVGGKCCEAAVAGEQEE
jgi:hypothetical protein